MTVLIADVAPDSRATLAAALRRFDRRIVPLEADDGREAARLLIEKKPDVAFVNVKLPEMDGAEAVAVARMRQSHSAIILMSDRVLSRWVALSTELDAYEFLTKPFDPDHVAALMEALTRMKQPLRLLLVEDSATARTLVRKVLLKSRFNLEIDETDTGRHAIKLMRLTRYDLALIDLNMAGIDGFETACLAKEISPETTLVLMSGSRNENIETASRHFGVRAFLQKPFYAHNVEDVLHEIYGLRRPYLYNVIGRDHTSPALRAGLAGAT